MTIHAVIWDLGGVLVRTEDYTRRDALAERLGMTRHELEDVFFGGESGEAAQRGEISFKQHLENIRQRLGLSASQMRAFTDDFWGNDYVDRELIDYIRSLKENYKIGLLSNAFSDLHRMLTQVWDIDDAFDELVISAEVGIVKPDRRVYEIALERLDVAPPESVFIDDFQHNIEGARAVGMHGVHFRSPEQARADLERILDGEQPA
jgi:epoxide hydrolase-like predicted phosphatase